MCLKLLKFFMFDNKAKKVNDNQEGACKECMSEDDSLHQYQNFQNKAIATDIAPMFRTMPENHAATLAVIYRSELDYLSRFIADYTDKETGGHLFGYWTVQGAPVVLYVTGPGQNCMHGRVECHHDHNYYNQVRDKLENTIVLQHIGDWHSHHQLNLRHPSGGDVQAMLVGVGSQPGMLRRHLMCIGTYDKGETFIDAYTFHQNDIPNYMHAAWKIIETESPFRQLCDKLLENILIAPVTKSANMGQLYTIEDLMVGALNNIVESKPKLYWIDECSQNRNIMKVLLEETSKQYPDKKVEIMATEDNYVFINVGNGEHSILFAEPFPSSAPYYYKGDTCVQSEAPWNCDENSIEFCYKNWLSQVAGSPVTGAQQAIGDVVDEVANNDDAGHLPQLSSEHDTNENNDSFNL